MAKLNEIRCIDERLPDGKQQYLVTGGGKIVCLRCTANSTRTKLQCGRPAIKTSRTQKCLAHEGRPLAQETPQRISKSSAVHSQATKDAKLEGHTAGSVKWNGPRTAEGKQRIAQAQLKHGFYSKAGLAAKHADAIKLRQLEDIAILIGMIQGPRTRGCKPQGYRPITSMKAVKELMALELLLKQSSSRFIQRQVPSGMPFAGLACSTKTL